MRHLAHMLWAGTLLSTTALTAPLPSESAEGSLVFVRRRTAASSLAVGVELFANGWQAEETQSRIAGAEVGLDFRRQLDQTVALRLAGSLQLEAGTTRARYHDEFKPRPQQRLREASLAWEPFRIGTLAFGSLDQDRWGSPLLVRRQSFPGFFEQLRLPLGPGELQLSATQTVATDTSSLQRWGGWSSRLPSFSLERIEFRIPEERRAAFRVYASHYLFDAMSHAQAWEAQFLGNSVVGLAPETAQFRYAFQGFEAGTDLSVQAAPGVRPFVALQGMRNNAAPRGAADGWRVSVGTVWQATTAMRLRPSFEVFRVESDASPAAFNTRTFGHNNRRGGSFGVEADWARDKIHADLRWTRASVLRASPLQSDAHWVSASVRLDYDVL